MTTVAPMQTATPSRPDTAVATAVAVTIALTMLAVTSLAYLALNVTATLYGFSLASIQRAFYGAVLLAIAVPPTTLLATLCMGRRTRTR